MKAREWKDPITRSSPGIQGRALVWADLNDGEDLEVGAKLMTVFNATGETKVLAFIPFDNEVDEAILEAIPAGYCGPLYWTARRIRSTGTTVTEAELLAGTFRLNLMTA